jgi:hypothetical protein
MLADGLQHDDTNFGVGVSFIQQPNQELPLVW